MQIVSGGRRPVAAIAKMVTNVSTTPVHFGVGIVKGPEYVHGPFLEDISHHVEAAAMCHPHHDFLDMVLGRFFQGEVEHWN